jgi:hypothetical protein
MEDDDLFAWGAKFGTPLRPMNPREAEFWKHHDVNPRMYELFNQFAGQAVVRRPRYSSDAILHRIRWFTDIESTGEPFKVNDHYSAYYARLWMRDHPEHAGFFETRATRVRTSKALDP